MIAAIIVVYKEQDMVPALLAQLEKQVDEIVVMANAPLTFPVPEGIRTVTQSNIGFGPAVNKGVQEVPHATHYLIINPDMRVEKGMVQKLINTMTNESADIVQPTILCENESINTTGNTLTFYGISYPEKYGERNLPIGDEEVFIASGACFLVTKEAWQQLGGFAEPYFMYHEDTDLSWRAELLGVKKICSAEAHCWHAYTQALPHWKLQYLERNRLLMLATNFTVPTLLLMLPALLFFELGMVTYALWKGWGKEKIQSFGVLWKERQWLAAQRKRVQSTRRKKDKEILAAMKATVEVATLASPAVRYILHPVMHGMYFVLRHIWW